MEPAALPRYFENVVADPTAWTRKGRYSNAAPAPSGAETVVRPGFDPAQLFVDDLKVRFSR